MRQRPCRACTVVWLVVEVLLVALTCRFALDTFTIIPAGLTRRRSRRHVDRPSVGGTGLSPLDRSLQHGWTCMYPRSDLSLIGTLVKVYAVLISLLSFAVLAKLLGDWQSQNHVQREIDCDL